MLPWEDWSDADTVVPHTSAWMRATSPSGSAEFEGRISWSGELGFGVRAAELGQAGDTPPEVEETGDAEATEHTGSHH
jgi:NADH-quinone oxidoreductase subunit I